MNEILECFMVLEQHDMRQKGKVLHKLSDIVGISFFAMLTRVDDWKEIQIFCESNIDFLRNYFSLEHDIPSHDTIQRAFAMIDPDCLSWIQQRFYDLLQKEEGKIILKMLAIDGKTQRGTKTATQKANHIVSAVDEHGICLIQVLVNEKTNEIKAIPELLEQLNIKKTTITIDAMGTQTEIVKKIKQKKADCVLNVHTIEQ